jgi:hypothetical protein
VSGVEKPLYGELVFVVCFELFDRHEGAPVSMDGWVMRFENIFTNVNAHKKLAFQR